MAKTPAERQADYRIRHGKGPTGKPSGRVKLSVNDKLASLMLASAKFRAKRDGYAFSITHKDIAIPDVCPILGTAFTISSSTGKATATSATLDKINPELGYVPGNVRVISHAANRLKDANTIATLERLLAYCRGEI